MLETELVAVIPAQLGLTDVVTTDPVFGIGLGSTPSPTGRCCPHRRGIHVRRTPPAFSTNYFSAKPRVINEYSRFVFPISGLQSPVRRERSADRSERLALAGDWGLLILVATSLRQGGDLLDDIGIGERGHVAELALLRNVREESAHDLARPGLGEIVGKDN